MRSYKCLSVNHFKNGPYSLVPIRDEDKYEIMKWRNEQIDILRQKELLTKEMQENYFKTVINKLFNQQHPNQLLWSFLENNKLIGYGGLVHIDWESKNGEISFLIETQRSTISENFVNDFHIYLNLVKEIAKQQLNFIKIYTYAFDIRKNLYEILLQSNFIEEARLKSHVIINNKDYDVLIHSCFLNH
jgi:hypothetical protein